jgi:signal transduction histidine kinase
VSASPRSPIGFTGLTALAIGIGVLLGIVGASVWLSAANRSALELVNAEQTRYRLLTSIRGLVTEAETGQRGFLLTGKPSYLEPHDAAVRALDTVVSQLERSVADDQSRGAVAALRAAVADKMAELRETIDLAARGERDQALTLVQTDRGQRAMDAIQAITDQMSHAEQATIAQQFEAINTRGNSLVMIAATGLVGLLLLATVIAWGVRRYLAILGFARSALEAANRQLENSNVVLERTVANRTADLVEANEEIQRFAYIVSHDLRAPLVNIMGFTSELESATAILAGFAREAGGRQPEGLPHDVAEAANDDIPEAIRFIKASTAKMDLLIGAILRLSREGRRVLTPEPLDMTAVLTRIVESVRHQAVNQSAEVTVGALPPVTADRVAIEQVFGNLLDNALKYLKPGRSGQVTVTGQMDGRMAVFEVRDNGRGIADKDRGRIFELFRRAGDQTVPGEGIGLAHVRALVRRLGGTITCDSRLDEGTVFKVRLPATMPTARSTAA